MKINKPLFISLMIVSLSACNVKSLSDLSVSEETSRHTAAQMAYLTSADYSSTSPYNGNMSVSAPNPVHLSWKSKGLKSISLNIYKDEQLSKLAVSYTVNGDTFDFYNTEVGQTYYATVTSGDLDLGPVEFTIDNKGPRNLYLEGVENIRDLGGWGKIKQGLIYRSGRFNEDKEESPKASISESGLYEAKNHLKIKTEIDLRRTSTNEVGGLTNKSVLGDDVNYVQLPMYYGGNNILTFVGKASGDTYDYNNPQMIKQFFEILGNQVNYPIDFHCSIGKDRTGCLAYLTEALLGFEEETLYRDYMFTNFANAGMCKITDISDKYGKTISEYEGESLQNKTYKYLNEVVGVSTETLDSVINILKA